MSADKDATLLRFVRVTATHHVKSDWLFAVDTVVDTLQKVVVPGQLRPREIDRGVVGELGFAGVAQGFGAMEPWADEQPLQARLRFPQRDVIQVGDRPRPRV